VIAPSRSPAARAAIALLAAGGLAGCGGVQAAVDRGLQRMRVQPRADVYEASRVFADGKVLQAPPAGTVPRERVLDPELSTGRDSAGGLLGRVPMPVTPELLARGRSRFRIYCGACHGAGGFGGSVVAENFTDRRPPSLRAGYAAALPAGLVFQVATAGFGLMPGYAAELSLKDRWAVVAYAQSIRGRAPADSAERDDSARASWLQRLDSLRLASKR
jgi:mono/diheme cytochrome c family protein